MRRTDLLLSAGAACAILGWTGAAGAFELPGTGGFTVNGKKGIYVSTVDQQKLATARQSQTSVATGDKSLGEQSINKGEFAGYGMPVPKTQQAINDLIQRMTQTLQERWPYLNPGPITVHIVASTSYSPASQPDNSIVIPFGFLMRAKSEDEVAWVLAHEISHLSLAHFARTAEYVRRKQMIDSMADMAITAMDAERIRAQDTGNNTVRLYQINDPAEAKRAASTRDYQDNLRLTLRLIGQGASREQEDQADAAGADIVMAMGLDAEDGAQAALAQIKMDDDRAAKLNPSFGGQMEEAMKKSVSSSGAQLLTGNITGAVFTTAKSMAKAAGQNATQSLLTSMLASHRPTAQRQSGMHSYFAVAYKGVSRDTEDAWIKALQGTPEFQEASNAVTARDTASALLDAGKIDEAAAAIAPLQGTPYAERPFVANMTAQIQEAQGNYGVADRMYDQADAVGTAKAAPPAAAAKPVPVKVATPAVKTRKGKAAAAPASAQPSAPPPAPAAPRVTDPFLMQSLQGFQDHVSLLVRHDQFPKARAKITEAQGRFGDHEGFLPDLIFISLRTNKAEEMTAYFEECRRTQNDALWARCKLAIFDETQKDKLKSLSLDQRAKLDKAMERSSEEAGRGNQLKTMLEDYNKMQTAPKSPG